MINGGNSLFSAFSFRVFHIPSNIKLLLYFVNGCQEKERNETEKKVLVNYLMAKKKRRYISQSLLW